jgi:hypothetical protein
LGRPRIVLLATLVVTPLVLMTWKVLWSAGFSGALDAWPGRLGFRCVGLSLLLGGWPLAALILARRRSDPLHPALTGAAFGVAVGACTWVMVDLWCPVAYVPHLLLGHLAPLLALAATGALLGRPFIAVRTRDAQ